MTGETSRYCAVSNKARAMYGRRLKPPDYALMINMTSVAQIAAFLKQHQSFMDVLSGINENNIRRNYLESLIKSSFFTDYEKLRHFLSPEDMLFYIYYIMSL